MDPGYQYSISEVNSDAMFTCKMRILPKSVVFKVWPKNPWAPSAVWQGQNYIHNVTKMLLPFILSFAEYTMNFTKSYIKLYYNRLNAEQI